MVKRGHSDRPRGEINRKSPRGHGLPRRSLLGLCFPVGVLSFQTEVRMAKRMDSDIRRWALIGAEQRLLQLAEEAAAIHKAFPELRQPGTGGRPPVSSRQADESEVASGRRGRKRKRTMSAAARKRISEAQKARWAKQKTGKK